MGTYMYLSKTAKCPHC